MAENDKKAIQQIQGLATIMGVYSGKVDGTLNQATQDLISKINQSNKLDPAKASLDDTAGALRTAFLKQPDGAVTNMQKLMGAGNKTPDQIAAVQTGLAVFGTPVAPTGTMNAQTEQGLASLVAVQQREAQRSAKTPTAEASAAGTGAGRKDPDVQKAQALLRALGRDSAKVDGSEREIAVDGIEGPITKSAISQYKKDNKIAEDAPLGQVIAHMEKGVQNNPDVDKRMQGIAVQGPLASRNDGFTLQTFLNVMAEFMSALTGKKLNLDGVIGPKTQGVFGQFADAKGMTPLQPAAPAVAQKAPAATPQASPAPAAPAATPPAPAAADTLPAGMARVEIPKSEPVTAVILPGAGTADVAPGQPVLTPSEPTAPVADAAPASSPAPNPDPALPRQGGDMAAHFNGNAAVVTTAAPTPGISVDPKTGIATNAEGNYINMKTGNVVYPDKNGDGNVTPSEYGRAVAADNRAVARAGKQGAPDGVGVSDVRVNSNGRASMKVETPIGTVPVKIGPKGVSWSGRFKL